MPFSPEELVVDFFPQVGFTSPQARAVVWDAYRTAGGALSRFNPNEPGPAIRSPLIWSQEDAGWLAQIQGPHGEVIAWLDFGGGSLWIERRQPQEGAWIELDGRTSPSIVEWVLETSARLSGLAPSTTPDKSAGGGAPLALDNSDARVDLESLYEGAGLLLSVVAEILQNAGHTPAPPRLDTTTFVASLTIDTRAQVRIELQPPSADYPFGCWAVIADAGTDPSLSTLSAGTWISRGRAHAAVLPINELTAFRSGEEQNMQLAGFLASALNTCLEPAGT